MTGSAGSSTACRGRHTGRRGAQVGTAGGAGGQGAEPRRSGTRGGRGAEEEEEEEDLARAGSDAHVRTLLLILIKNKIWKHNIYFVI